MTAPTEPGTPTPPNASASGGRLILAVVAIALVAGAVSLWHAPAAQPPAEEPAHAEKTLEPRRAIRLEVDAKGNVLHEGRIAEEPVIEALCRQSLADGFQPDLKLVVHGVAPKQEVLGMLLRARRASGAKGIGVGVETTPVTKLPVDGAAPVAAEATSP